jgi:CDP-4-dehydro-6-deoxyglucose reductase
MTAKVRVLPSGHEFMIESGESLLDAALRAGLSLRYSCNSGSCGDCRARRVSGELGEMLHHDYVLSESERAAGQFLLCRASAASDLVLEVTEARGVADVPHQQLSTQVSKLERLNDDVMEVHVRTPRSKTLWFLAGQHVQLTLGDLTPRSKSIASCPCNGMVLQFHVRHVANDPFSDYVFSKLRLRDTIEIEGPSGAFVLDEVAARPIIFIAFETGFAPIKSLIEHAIALDIAQPIWLYWVARHAQDHYLANYCRSWHDALDAFEFVEISGDETGTMTAAEVAMARAAARIRTDHPDLSGFDVYANGPDTLFAEISAVLLAQGLPPERLFIDHVQRF